MTDKFEEWLESRVNDEWYSKVGLLPDDVLFEYREFKEEQFNCALKMTDKVLSVKEAEKAVYQITSDAFPLSAVDAAKFIDRVQVLVSAVRHEERERAVKIIEEYLGLDKTVFLRVEEIKKKILEEK